MSVNNGNFNCNGIFRYFSVLLQFVHCSDAFHFLGVRYPGFSLAVFSLSNYVFCFAGELLAKVILENMFGSAYDC